VFFSPTKAPLWTLFTEIALDAFKRELNAYRASIGNAELCPGSYTSKEIRNRLVLYSTFEGEAALSDAEVKLLPSAEFFVLANVCVPQEQLDAEEIAVLIQDIKPAQLLSHAHTSIRLLKDVLRMIGEV
jgi:hypothetical protein